MIILRYEQWFVESSVAPLTISDGDEATPTEVPTTLFSWFFVATELDISGPLNLIAVASQVWLAWSWRDVRDYSVHVIVGINWRWQLLNNALRTWVQLHQLFYMESTLMSLCKHKCSSLWMNAVLSEQCNPSGGRSSFMYCLILYKSSEVRWISHIVSILLSK